MLEKLNIDCVVLESYNTIAPQDGASIGLQASRLRVLDQLSCADTLLDLVDAPLQNQVVRVYYILYTGGWQQCTTCVLLTT